MGLVSVNFNRLSESRTASKPSSNEKKYPQDTGKPRVQRKKESQHEKANLSERNGGVKRGVKFAATNFKTHLRHIKPNFTLP